MPDLRWEHVSELFDPDLMGSLPDLFVPDSTVQDWQAVLDLVATSGWQWQFKIGTTEQPLQTEASVFARAAEAETAELRAWPVLGVLAIFRLWSETEISFDVDLASCMDSASVVDAQFAFGLLVHPVLGVRVTRLLG